MQLVNDREDWNVDQKVLGGDFNLVLDLEKDKKGGRWQTYKKASQFLKTYI